MTKIYYHLHPNGQRIGLAKDGKLIVNLKPSTIKTQIKKMDIIGQCVLLKEKDSHIKRNKQSRGNWLNMSEIKRIKKQWQKYLKLAKEAKQLLRELKAKFETRHTKT